MYGYFSCVYVCAWRPEEGMGIRESRDRLGSESSSRSRKSNVDSLEEQMMLLNTKPLPRT